MNRLSERTQLTDCIEEKLRNFLGYSMRSSYPEIEDLYNAAYESAERQCRMELELGPPNRRSQARRTRSRLNLQEGREMNNYMARLTAAQLEGYGNTYSGGIDPTLPPPGAKRPMKRPKKHQNNGYPPPAFSGFGGSRRTRRRTTKKRTRKQRRRG